MYTFKKLWSCCGIVECKGLSGRDLKTFFTNFNTMESRVGEKYRMVLFTDGDRHGNGEWLYGQLKKLDFGHISRTKSAPNPIHEEQPVRVYVWHPNKAFLDRLPTLIKKPEELNKWR